MPAVRPPPWSRHDLLPRGAPSAASGYFHHRRREESSRLCAVDTKSHLVSGNATPENGPGVNLRPLFGELICTKCPRGLACSGNRLNLSGDGRAVTGVSAYTSGG